MRSPESHDSTGRDFNQARSPERKIELPDLPNQDFYKDRKFCDILEAKSLEYLNAHDFEWFKSEYNGQVSPEGYLLDKNGKETNFLPSQSIGKYFDNVFAVAKRAYLEQYPEEAKRLEK